MLHFALIMDDIQTVIAHHVMLGDYQKAIEILEDEDPDDVEIYYKFGIVSIDFLMPNADIIRAEIGEQAFVALRQKRVFAGYVAEGRARGGSSWVLIGTSNGPEYALVMEC